MWILIFKMTENEKKEIDVLDVNHLKLGDKVFFKNNFISYGGRILFEENQEVTLTEIQISEGHYSRGCCPYWIPKQITLLKIEGNSGVFRPECFYLK